MCSFCGYMTVLLYCYITKCTVVSSHSTPADLSSCVTMPADCPTYVDIFLSSSNLLTHFLSHFTALDETRLHSFLRTICDSRDQVVTTGSAEGSGGPSWCRKRRAPHGLKTPPALPPVFYGSSLQDAPACQAVPPTKLRGMEQPGSAESDTGLLLVYDLSFILNQKGVVFYLSHGLKRESLKSCYKLTISSLFSSPAPVEGCRTWTTVTMSSMDDPHALRNNGHPSKSENAWLNGAQTGDTVQCSGPFPSDSHSTGVAWPQWDACFPQVAVSDAPPQCQGRGARRPFSAQWAELEKQTPTQTLTHLSRTHTLSCTHHTLRVPRPLSRKFRHEQLWGIREWQVYSRSQQAQRREADWQSSGITTQVEAVCWTKWATCLSASLASPRGFF